MDPTQILEVEAATDAFALALTDVLLDTEDAWYCYGITYERVREEAAMAATDIGLMILGIPDIESWGEGVAR